MRFKYPLLCCLLVCSTVLNAQIDIKFWNDIAEENLPEKERWIVPDLYRVVAADQIELESYLLELPLEFTNASPGILEVPFPDGTWQQFEMYNSPVAEAELEEKFPMIRNFRGQGLTEPSARIRCDITTKGFHAIIHSQKGTVYIDPYFKDKTQYYSVYFTRDYSEDEVFVCHTETEIVKGLDPLPNLDLLKNPQGLRTYRAAIAATGEYTAWHSSGASNVADGLSGINTTVMRLNSVFEVDFGTRLILVGNNDQIVYTNAGSDPYNSQSLNENQNNIDNVIGFSNYDIGHLFHQNNGGGVAQLGSVCGSGKARGFTSTGSPSGDPFDIDYVAHEMGHQFNAYHTQNNNCNRTAGESYEPGSASTIMGYAGICSPNVQFNSDDHFHAGSLDRMIPFITSSGCGEWISTGNNPPSVDAGSNYVIPRGTPFVLEGSATDPDSDALTFCWEQMDAQFATMPPAATNSSGPAFRSNSPTTSSTRYLPNLEDLLNNDSPTWEVLSNVSRSYNWRLTVRDNNSAGGCVESDTKQVTVIGSSGPFRVSSPNTAVNWAGGQNQTVTWDVAGTSSGAVNCDNVDILLSLDGGFNYPITIVGDTSNDGSQSIVVPNVSTDQARIMIRCSDNIFFDVTNSNFSITADATATSCFDGVLNGFETGVDCGGPSCPPCDFCSDGIQNMGETGIDCGGPCAPCGGTVKVKVKLHLEGAKLPNSNFMSKNLFESDLLPLQQPYNVDPYNYGGGEAMVSYDDFPVSTVDWVFVQIRSAADHSLVLGKRAALLKSDGRLMDLDGSEGVEFQGLIPGGSYKIVIFHKSHLAVMSSADVVLPNNSQYDFTTSANKAAGSSQLVMNNGKWALRAGDYDGSGTVNFSDFIAWLNTNNILDQYLFSDADCNGTVNFFDFVLWLKNNNIIRFSDI